MDSTVAAWISIVDRGMCSMLCDTLAHADIRKQQGQLTTLHGRCIALQAMEGARAVDRISLPNSAPHLKGIAGSICTAKPDSSAEGHEGVN